jgi:hypothetical protein
MMLNDNDALTSASTLRLLNSGVSQLSPMRRELINAFFLSKVQAPKRLFCVNHMMCGKDVDSEVRQALFDLRKHFTQQGITSLADFGVD